MSGLESLQSVQFVTVAGKRFAVVSATEWEALVEWLEECEDVRLTREALAELQAHAGDRDAAGWHRWEDVRARLL
jgi:hypothetical protein